MLLVLAIYWTVSLSSKTIRWMASTCLSVVEVLGRSNWGAYFVLSLPRLNSTAHFLTVALKFIGKYLYNVLMNFVGCYTFLLHILYHCSASILSTFTFLHTPLICMGLTDTEIKLQILISFFGFIECDSILLQQKCSAMALLSGWVLKHFRRTS